MSILHHWTKFNVFWPFVLILMRVFSVFFHSSFSSPYIFTRPNFSFLFVPSLRLPAFFFSFNLHCFSFCSPVTFFPVIFRSFPCPSLLYFFFFLSIFSWVTFVFPFTFLLLFPPPAFLSSTSFSHDLSHFYLPPSFPPPSIVSHPPFPLDPFALFTFTFHCLILPGVLSCLRTDSPLVHTFLSSYNMILSSL